MVSKQTFEVEWHGERIEPQRIRALITEHAKLYCIASSCNVRETTEQPSIRVGNDRYHVVMTVGFPIGVKRLNEMAAGGWKLRGIVAHKDTSVNYDRERFTHYFEKEPGPKKEHTITLIGKIAPLSVDRLNATILEGWRFVRAKLGKEIVRCYFEKEA